MLIISQWLGQTEQFNNVTTKASSSSNLVVILLDSPNDKPVFYNHMINYYPVTDSLQL